MTYLILRGLAAVDRSRSSKQVREFQAILLSRGFGASGLMALTLLLLCGVASALPLQVPPNDAGGRLSTVRPARLSPRESAVQTLAGNEIQIDYGRPYRKGRKIFGGMLNYGKMWRTGADEASVLTTRATIMIGSLAVPPGSYSLFTIPNKERWTLILNKVPDFEGRGGYDRKKDLGRAEMSVERLPEIVEQFTIRIDKASEARGTLNISWESVRASAPVSAK
jgi:hypothetical protein